MSFDLPRALKTATFRFASLGAGMFMLFSVFILWFVYGSAEAAIERQADRSLRAEVEDLVGIYATGGLNRVNRAVLERTLGQGEYLYLLVDPFSERISGGLTAIPANALERIGEPVRFVFQRPGMGESTRSVIGGGNEGALSRHRGRAIAVGLPADFRLMVAMDLEQELEILSRTGSDVWRVLVLIGALSLIAGYLLARRFASRVDALDQVARRVMAGDLGIRAPRNHTGDELDNLSASLNAMLERLQRLMDATRHAGDAIAHGLRTPVTRVRARLETSREETDPAQFSFTIEESLHQIDELLGVFDAVLRLSRLRAGERRAAFQKTDLTEIALDVSELYEAVADEKGAAFATEVSEDVVVLGDRSLLFQAVCNLVDNAIKYTPSGGGITLRLRHNNAGLIELSVTDTGPGVAPEDRERITERFVRLDHSRNEPGSGLGLAMVVAVADLHSGRLTIEDGSGSTMGEGRGLRAVLTFPRFGEAIAVGEP
jgi:signal transduction histidine kinase